MVGGNWRAALVLWSIACSFAGCIDKPSALQLFHASDAADVDAVGGADVAESGDIPGDGDALDAPATCPSTCEDSNPCTGAGVCKAGVCTFSRGLISTWHGDGTANDAIGPYHGALFGSTIFGNGFAAQAFSFPGAGGVNFGSSAGTFSTNTWTIELWVKTTATGQYAVLARRAACSGEIGPWWEMRVNAGKIQFEVFTGAAYVAMASPTAVINDGSWHHIAFVRDGDSLSLYQDGALQIAKAGMGSALNDTTATNLLLGSGPCIGASDGTKGFQGAIDEISLYGRALTAADVAAQANGQCIGMGNNCVAGNCANR